MMLGGGGGGGGGGDEYEEGLGLGRMSMMMNQQAAAAQGERVPLPVVQAQTQWSQQETREFIGIRAKLETERDFSTNGNKRSKTTTLWEVVSARMREKGYRRTPDQCKCKWKNLLNRYKGKETTDTENVRQCPFFDELHAIFTQRAKQMQRSLVESEAGSTQAKKRVKRQSEERLSDEFSQDEDEDEDDSEEERPARSNPRKRKAERVALDKSSRAIISGSGNAGTSSTSSRCIQELLKEFFQQQQRMEMQWREIMERRAQDRLTSEQEWRHSMVKLERERLIAEQTWREREEQRRIREETRAERRDILLNTLLNKLIHENSL